MTGSEADSAFICGLFTVERGESVMQGLVALR